MAAQISLLQAPHFPGVKGCQDVSKVAGGHNKINPFTQGNYTLRNQVQVGRKIVDDLGGTSLPQLIELAEDRMNFLACSSLLKSLSPKISLTPALGVVKISPDCYYRHVIAFLGNHLQFCISLTPCSG